MRELNLIAKIIDGNIKFESENWQKKITSIEKTAAYSDISVTLKVMDTPEHWQHKYFHGFLLPDLAHAQGETDLDYLKYMLKAEFLIKGCDKFSDIPSRFKSRCMPIMKEIMGVQCLTGYIPSLGDLTYDEMKTFILKCEFILVEDLNGQIRKPETALEFRNKAFNTRSLKNG